MTDGATEFRRCRCPHCGGPIEFPAEAAGAGIECPHCGDAMNLVEAVGGVDDHDGEAGSMGAEGMPVRDGRPTAAELAAGFAGRVERGRPRGGYWFALWMGAGMAVAIPVVYGLLVVGLGWGLWRVGEVGWAWVRAGDESMAMRGVQAGLWVLGLGLGAMVWGFLLRPFLVRAGRRPTALALNPASEPLVYALVHMVCDAVGAPRPVRVEVDCRMNASVDGGGGTGGLGGAGAVLRLGLPLVAGLSVTQFAGVLAHEMGHFGLGWGMRASRLIRGLDRWMEGVTRGELADMNLDPWGRAEATGFQAVALGIVRIGVGISRGVLGLVTFAGRLARLHLSREMEREADRIQIRLVGSDVFESTFRRLCVLSEARRNVYRELGKAGGRTGRWPEDLPSAVVEAADGVPEEVAERWCERRLAREADPWSSHPTDSERIERARALAEPGLFRCGGTAASLFSHFEALARQVTALHYREDLGRDAVAGGEKETPAGGGSGGR